MSNTTLIVRTILGRALKCKTIQSDNLEVFNLELFNLQLTPALTELVERNIRFIENKHVYASMSKTAKIVLTIIHFYNEPRTVIGILKQLSDDVLVELGQELFVNWQLAEGHYIVHYLNRKLPWPTIDPSIYSDYDVAVCNYIRRRYLELRDKQSIIDQQHN